MVPPIAHRRPCANRSRNGPISGATITNGSIVRPRNSATWPRASPDGTWKKSDPASEIATAASPAVLKTCIWISRDSPDSPAPCASDARLADATVTRLNLPVPRASPTRPRPVTRAPVVRPWPDPSRAVVGVGSEVPSGWGSRQRCSSAMRSSCPDVDDSPRHGHAGVDLTLPHSISHASPRDRPSPTPRPTPRPTPSPPRRWTRPATPSSRTSAPLTSATTSAPSARASAWSPTSSPAPARGTSAGTGRSRWPAPRGSATSPSTRSSWSPATPRSSRRSGCPTASGSSPATCPRATCCRSTTTTRGSCRRTPSATTRSTTTTRRRSARSPRTSASAGSGRSRPRAATSPPSAGPTATPAPTRAIAQAAPDRCHSCGFLLRITGPLADTFGVCANGDANDDGRVVTFDHGCGAHSEVRIQKKHEPVPIPDHFLDTLTSDEIETF